MGREFRIRSEALKIFGLALLVFSLSCSEHAPTGWKSQYGWYPLAVGNTWEYQGYIASIKIQPDTLSAPWLDTLYSTAQVKVVDLVTLLDSFVTYKLKDLLVQDGDSYPSWSYYNNQREGLYFYAYEGASNLPPAQLSSGYRIYFKGKYFRDLIEFIQRLELALVFQPPLPTQLIYEIPPLKAIEYPLRIGAQWTYRPRGEPWRIDKQVVGKTFLRVPVGSFSCWVIKWLYDLDDDQVWDNDIQFLDYLSSSGIVKRSILIKNIVLIDEFGNQIGTYDFVEETELISLRLFRI